MEYQHFSEEVKRIAGRDHYYLHNHLLVVVPAIFRERYLYTLGLDFNIPDALEHIRRAGKLPEKNYSRYIKYFHFQRELTAILAG